MLPDRIAFCAALVLAVSARRPAIEFETFWNFVLPDSSHRCSEPLDDCRIRNFFVARTTMPRWTASVLPLCLAWLNCRAWVSRASWAYELCLDPFQWVMAELRTVPSLPAWDEK